LLREENSSKTKSVVEVLEATDVELADAQRVLRRGDEGDAVVVGVGGCRTVPGGIGGVSVSRTVVRGVR
jgi:hypothetical protein